MEKTVAAQDLQVKIVEIKGRCPVYAIGDGFRILGGWKLQAQRPICLHALSSLMPYYVALSRGIPPSDLGLGDAGDGDRAVPRPLRADRWWDGHLRHSEGERIPESLGC